MSAVSHHKICFLGYSKLYTLAKSVIDAIPPSDVTFLLFDCDMDNQDEVVRDAINAGCTVFVAGPGNAARFQANYNLPLVEIPISSMDYAIAVQAAYKQHCKKVGIVHHRDSPPLNLEQIQLLLNKKITVIEYESFQGLFAAVRESECDGIVGTAGAIQAAESAGKAGFLAYLSTEGIQLACERAAELARELWLSQKNRATMNTVMNTSQLGIIVAEADGKVTYFNRVAQEYTGLLPSQIRGRPIQEFFPNLSAAALLKSAKNRSDSYRLVAGVMMRCVQEKILLRSEAVGIVTTLHPEAHNRQHREERKTDFNSHIYRWADLQANSSAMQTLVTKGKALSRRNEPTVIFGESGSGREEIAYCIHGGSGRADYPCITLDLAALSQQDASRILLGYEMEDRRVNGLLVDANRGSVVLKNLHHAPPAALACIQEILNRRQIFRPYMESPLNLQLSFFTVCTHRELETISPDLRSQLSIQVLEMPSLRQRKEDIGALFLKYLSQLSDLPTRYAMTSQMESLLMQYSWPGNVWELRSVCQRYVIAREEIHQPTPKQRYAMLLEAIGEDALFEDLLKSYPILQQKPAADPLAFEEAFLSVKAWMHYSNEQMAEKLNIGRTSLWRIMKK